MTSTTFSLLFGAFGAIVAIGLLIRWIWHSLPHPHQDLLHRISEIVVAVKSLPDAMRQSLVSSLPPEAIQSWMKSLEEHKAAQEAEIESIKENRIVLQQQLAALDVIAERINKQSEYVQLFCRTITGNDPGGYQEVNEESAMLRERAVGLQRRYSIPWEEAMSRAKQMQPYFSTDQGFGAEAR